MAGLPAGHREGRSTPVDTAGQCAFQKGVLGFRLYVTQANNALGYFAVGTVCSTYPNGRFLTPTSISTAPENLCLAKASQEEVLERSPRLRHSHLVPTHTITQRQMHRRAVTFRQTNTTF